MYSPRVIESEQALLESRLNIPLTRYDASYSLSVVEDLDRQRSLLLSSTPSLSDAQVVAALSKDRREFIRNERLLSTIDFTYWKR
jgi:hypothetical protein